MQFAMGKAQLGKIHRFPSSFRFKEININVYLDDSDLLGGKISLAVRDSDFNAKHGRLSVTMQRSHFGGSSYSFIFFFFGFEVLVVDQHLCKEGREGGSGRRGVRL